MASLAPASGGPRIPIPILVIGDWVVDENWVLARHRSSLSTMEGKAHLRALGAVGSRVMTFCGAGRVARYLYWWNRYQEPQTSDEKDSGWLPLGKREEMTLTVFGLGTWAEKDEPKLYRMFYPRYPDGINPFTLTRVDPRPVPYKHLDGLYLRNLAPAYQAQEEHAMWRSVGTTRVYRLYNLQAETPGGLVLDRRVDFELRYSPDRVDSGREYNEKRLLAALADFPLWLDPGAIAARVWQENTLKNLANLRQQILDDANEELPDLKNAFLTIADTIQSAVGRQPREHEASRPFRYVIVKDLGKGTVTSKLLKALSTQGLIDEDTLWFVSSKRLNPPYLDLLKNPSRYGSIRLLFLPPMVIAQIEHEGGQNRFGSKWFVAGQKPTKEGLDKLEEFHKLFRHEGRTSPTLVIAMPKGLSILGLEDLGPDHLVGYKHPQPVLDQIDEELTGRASMFFSALTAQLVQEDHKQTLHGQGECEESSRKDRLNEQSQWRCEMIEAALKASYDVVRGNINALKNFGGENLGEREAEVFSFDPSFKHYQRGGNAWRVSPVQRVTALPWKKEISLWSQSRTHTGIIQTHESGRYTLDLWRAMGELDEYIEIIDKRRRSIVQLLSALREFLHAPPQRSFSAMLIAKPGTGKSHLVSRLATTLGMAPLSFNITQMIARQDINACFEEIASAQARDRDHTHLVFFDEINSQVERANVYELFLTVLEDGTYLRAGRRFKLDPCAFLFAGTRELDDQSDEAYERKEVDFKSRLTITAIKLDDEGSNSDTRRSLIYQGALQIVLQHTDVKKISALVLKAFASLKKSNNRKIRQLASQFNNIRYGEVRKINLPVELLKALDDEDDPAGTEFQTLFIKGQSVTHDALDNLLVEIKLQPDKDDYGEQPPFPS